MKKNKAVTLYASILIMTFVTLTLVAYFFVIFKYNNSSKKLDEKIRKEVLNTYEDFGYESYLDERMKEKNND